jgi:hypothetical protein
MIGVEWWPRNCARKVVVSLASTRVARRKTRVVIFHASSLSPSIQQATAPFETPMKKSPDRSCLDRVLIGENRFQRLSNDTIFAQSYLTSN